MCIWWTSYLLKTLQASFALEYPSSLRGCDGTGWLGSSGSGTSEGIRCVFSEDLFALSVEISFDEICRNPQLSILDGYSGGEGGCGLHW